MLQQWGYGMTYFELVDRLKALYNLLDPSEIKYHFAVQFNIRGEGEGALYVEFGQGFIDVQPYEYMDRDIIITTGADIAVGLAAGTVVPLEAYKSEKLEAWGDLDKLIDIYDVIFKKYESKKACEESSDKAENKAENKVEIEAGKDEKAKVDDKKKSTTK